MIAKLEWTQRKRTLKHRTITESHNVSNNQQRLLFHSKLGLTVTDTNILREFAHVLLNV